jgi:hypothetical protein
MRRELSICCHVWLIIGLEGLGEPFGPSLAMIQEKTQQLKCKVFSGKNNSKYVSCI